MSNNLDTLERLLTKMGMFYERLTQKFTSMGLEIEDEDLEQTQPVLKAEEKIEQLISQFINRIDEVFEEHTALGQVLKQNEQFMTTFYDCMLGVTQSFIKYSKQLYSSPQSLQSLRSFRMLYEAFSNCSTLLNGYTALTQDFAQSQKKYVEQQVSLFSKIVFKEQKQHINYQQVPLSASDEVLMLRQQNSQLKQVLRRYEDELSKYTSRQQQMSDKPVSRKSNLGNQELLGKIEQLETIIAENNDQFAIEVQRYNRLLYEQREQLNRLEAEADQEVRRLQFSFRQIEKQLQSYKQEKFKDQLMIQNMARKLRGYEREKRGYGSPPARINLSSGKSSALHIGLPKRQDSGYLYKRDIDF